MLVKLGSTIQKDGGSVNRKTLEEMVMAYRTNPTAQDEKLFYSHFKVEEIIQLLIDNGALSAGAIGHVVANHGMKIYIGRHTNEDNCPVGRAYYPGTDRPYYMNRDTTIVCTTIMKDGSFRYEDKLELNKDTVMMPGMKFDDPGEALDQSSTYPPDNPYSPPPVPEPSPCDAFDIGHPCP